MNTLRKLRKIVGLTQFELGKRAGLTPARITFAETGRVRLNASEFERVKSVLIQRAAEVAQRVEQLKAA